MRQVRQLADDFTYGMHGKSGQHILEAFIRVDALQLAGARQTVHHGSAVGCLASSPKARPLDEWSSR